jgi:hypothetical protein
MNLRLTRIEEANDSTANDLKNFVGNQFSIVQECQSIVYQPDVGRVLHGGHWSAIDGSGT